MIWNPRQQTQPQTRRAAASPSSLLVAMSEAIGAIPAEGRRQRPDQLIDALAGCDAAADVELGCAALALLSGVPPTVLRLDEYVRSGWPYAPAPSGFVDQCAQQRAAGQLGPVGIAIACLHGDGRVRERAVEAMLAAPSPGLMPLLVLRTSDWVHQVRDRAHAGLALLLAIAGDPDLARRARAGATRLARDATRASWRHTLPPYLSITAVQRADLLHLAHRAAAGLGQDTARLLARWLEGIQPWATAPGCATMPLSLV